MKEKLIPIISVIIGLLAFSLTYRYLRAENKKLELLKQEIYEGARKVRVMAARKDIPSGTVIKPADLGTISVFQSSVGDHAVFPDDAQMLFGKKTLFRIDAKDPVFWSHIEGGALSASGLSPIIKEGLRAISLSVSGAEAVSGMVQPNDHVDILGTFPFPSKTIEGEMETVTLTILQDVSVLASGQQLAKMAPGNTRANRGGGTITVEVTPREAELLVFAQQMKGRLTLALRNPGDVSYESDLPEIDFEYLQEALPGLNLYRQQNIRHKRNVPHRASESQGSGVRNQEAGQEATRRCLTPDS